MNRDQQRQFQIGQERYVARDIHLEQDGDQRDDDQPNQPETVGLVLPGGTGEQPFCVLAH